LSTPSRHHRAALSTPKGATCADCYFRSQGLCALSLDRPCPTFRAAGSMLQPPYQARLVPRPVAVAY